MPKGKSKDSITNGDKQVSPHTISGINFLDLEEKRAIYERLIPPELLAYLNIGPELQDQNGNDLLQLNSQPGSSTAEMALYHQFGFPDPALYGQITDTMNGQIHVLLYVLNDPSSPRFDVDRMPDGSLTRFGTEKRNIEAEIAAMRFGLAPGQIRSGLRILKPAVQAFERFIVSLEHEMYFAEPLYYHNAIIFERYGFAYEKGRKLMERIQDGFYKNGVLLAKLDGSTPFRTPEAAHSIRLRSWALHDMLLEEPFTGVTMYKRIGKSAGLNTCPGITW